MKRILLTEKCIFIIILFKGINFKIEPYLIHFTNIGWNLWATRPSIFEPRKTRRKGGWPQVREGARKVDRLNARNRAQESI